MQNTKKIEINTVKLYNRFKNRKCVYWASHLPSTWQPRLAPGLFNFERNSILNSNLKTSRERYAIYFCNAAASSFGSTPPMFSVSVFSDVESDRDLDFGLGIKCLISIVQLLKCFTFPMEKYNQEPWQLLAGLCLVHTFPGNYVHEPLDCRSYFW